MRTYKYNFATAIGDTIMEKYEALYVLLAQAHEDQPVRLAVAGLEVASMFETARGGFEPSPIVAHTGDLMYVGSLTGTRLRFQVFKSARVAKNEMVLFGERGNAVVEFEDFVF